MKANLSIAELTILDYWQKNKTYTNLLEKRRVENAPSFILHDGPPYANGRFHVGHALNKILKDFIIKYHLLKGYYAPFVPGWDCHGLPIEHAIVKKLNNKKSKDIKNPVVIRQLCRDYAKDYLIQQSEDQTRFGIFWDNSSIDHLKGASQDKALEGMYYTMSPKYESDILEVFSLLFKEGLIYRAKKPVYWCPFLGTAHAEAEIEYKEHESPSIYVAFPIDASKDEYVVIWTTTPWTLPANLALCFHPDFQYMRYETERGSLILAEGLEDFFFKETSLTYSAKINISQDEIKALVVKHPFINRYSKIVFGEHVTLDVGTGVVHTAPGHGHDDYMVGLTYKLDTLSVVDDYGCYTDDFQELKGINLFVANEKIINWLNEKKLLLGYKMIKHSYPYSWRSHKPLIVRATYQWFFKVSNLRVAALDIAKGVEWVPDWGENRFTTMLENRPDWCLSRQRFWGVPIPELICKDCNASTLEVIILDQIVEKVRKEGVEIWFNKDLNEILEHEVSCSQCSSTNLVKGENILDVWFDSGVSWFSILKQNKSLRYPADIYFEGSDQHRGWFQSSLWPSLALNKVAPYKKVITHGYVLDGTGRAMSKSLGNVISPSDDVINQYGADVLRLWVSSEDFRTDNTVSAEILKRIADSYRKIRNTFRFLLGNLQDNIYLFNSPNELNKYIVNPIDKWVLHKLYVLSQSIEVDYQEYKFHDIYHKVVEFCVQILSNEYFDIIRDTLYCDSLPKENNTITYSLYQKSSLATLTIILKHLLVYLAPILSFTCEEIQQIIDPKHSVFESTWPGSLSEFENQSLDEFFDKVFKIKHDLNVQIEKLKETQKISSTSEITLYLSSTESASLLQQPICKELKIDCIALKTYFMVADVKILDTISTVMVEKEPKYKCSRCWLYVDITSEEELCQRCQKVISSS